MLPAGNVEHSRATHVEASAIVPASAVLDVAAGTGNASILAARAAAKVPEVLVGGLFKTMGPFAPTPPPGAQPPPIWGSEDHLGNFYA